MPRPAAILSVFGVVGVIVLTFAHPSTSRMLTWPWALLTSVLWLVPIAALAVLAAQPQWRRPPPFVFVGLALLAIGAVVSAVASPFGAASLIHVWPTLGGSALLLVLHHALSAPERHDRRVEIAAAILAGAAALLVIGSLALWLPTVWPVLSGNRNAVPFGHSTYTAGAVVFLIPWLLFYAWRSRGLLRLNSLVVVPLVVVVIASTSSRGGVAGVCVAAAVVAGGIVGFAPWSRRGKLTLVAALVIGGSIVVFSNPRLRELVLHRRWGESASESNLQRTAMLQAGRILGAQRPALGWGPGSIPLAYPRVRAQLDGGVDNVQQLHNTPLQLWATTGAFGVAGALLLVLGVSIAAFRGPRTALTLTAVASLAGFAAVALTDHQLDVPFIVAGVVLSAAILTSGVKRHQMPPVNRSSLARRLAPAVIALGAAIALPATVRDLRARHAWEQALDAFEQRDLPAGFAALDRGTAFVPHDPYFDQHYAHQLLSLRDRTNDRGQRDTLTREAISRLERAVRTRVHLEYSHFNLGWLYLDAYDPRSSARHFVAAAKLVPDKGGVYFGLGLALLEQERPEEAIRAFALEWINDPLSLSSPAWEIPTLARHIPAIQREVQQRCDALRPKTAHADVIGRWIRWWCRVPSVDMTSFASHNTESAAFIAAWPAIAAGKPLSANAAPFAWARAYAALFARDSSSKPTLPGDPVFKNALAQRAAKFSGDFRAFLVAPTGDDPAVLATYRRTRPGYGYLARHPDGPFLADVYIVQENRVTTTLASGLFPRKGGIPGRYLLALLPPLER